MTKENDLISLNSIENTNLNSNSLSEFKFEELEDRLEFKPGNDCGFQVCTY